MTSRCLTSVLLAFTLYFMCPIVSAYPEKPIPSRPAGHRLPGNDTRSVIHRRQRKQSRIEQIRYKILDQLGKADGPMGNVSDLSKDVIKAIMDEHRPGHSQNTSKIYSIAQKVKTIRGKSDILVTFNLKSLQTSDLRIMNVDLMVVVRCSKRRCRARKARRGGRREAPTTITLKIYNMLNSSGDNNGGRMITSLKVGVRRTKWQKLIVPTSVIQEVVDSPTRVLPIRIACVNCSKGIRPVAVRKARRTKNRKSRRDVGAAAERTRRPRRKPSAARRRERRLQNQRAKTGVKVRKKKQPFLVIYTRRVEQMGVRTMRELRTRQRRHDAQQSNGATSSPTMVCRKKTMYVSFRQLELDNVIVWPAGYHASFCDNVASDSGAQRLPHRRHISKLMMHIAHRRHIENTEHTSCCRPTKVAPLSVTYLLDKNTVVETSIPGLITTECGCVV